MVLVETAVVETAMEIVAILIALDATKQMGINHAIINGVEKNIHELQIYI